MGSIVLRLLAIVLFSQASQAMGGAGCCSSLTPRIRFGELTGHTGPGSDERNWMEAIVLWRRSDARPEVMTQDQSRKLEVEEFKARQEAEAASRGIMGGFYAAGYNYFTYNKARTKLWVSGREFRIPGEDSLVVVMVDRVDGVGGAPKVVGSVNLPLHLSADYWSKTWHSGDTTFSTHGKDRQVKILEALNSNSLTAEFLR